MKTVDLFAGCGGLSLGFQNAGFELVAAFDHWLPAQRVYQANFSHPIFDLDLASKDSISRIAEFCPTMIIGGPPCQDFSSAGKRDETYGRGDLTRSFAEIVTTICPQWFVMENVDRIQRSKILSATCLQFKEHGYGLTSIILNASYCGAPQARKRYFLIGELGGKDDVLTYFLNKNLASRPLTLSDYFGDRLGLEYYYRHPRSYQRRGIFSIYEPSPTIRGVNRPIPKTYQQHPGDACAPHPQLRPLTTIERSYIQTFPETFQFQGTKSDLEQMIGNAVPVKLAEYVARAILDYQRCKIAPTQALIAAQKIGQLSLFAQSTNHEVGSCG